MFIHNSKMQNILKYVFGRGRSSVDITIESHLRLNYYFTYPPEKRHTRKYILDYHYNFVNIYEHQVTS